MKSCVLLLFAVALASTQTLHAATVLTLDEALATALKSHPQVIEATSNLQSAEARTGQALANYYPQIGMSADWSKGRSYFAVKQAVLNAEVNSDLLYLKQNIYDFGRTAGALEAARSNRDAADKSLAVTRQDLALRVRSAFYLVLAAEKEVEAVRETVKARDDVYRQAQEFFSQGVRAKVDVAKAEANLFAAKTSLIRAENDRQIARVELANAMGIEALGERAVIAPAAVSVLLPQQNRVQQEAMSNRSEVQLLAALKRAANANLKTAKGSYLPVISGTASIGYADSNFPPPGKVWGVGLNLTMPLFSGFSSVEQVREASANIGAVEARQINLKLQIGKEAESAWLGVNEATARIASTEKQVAAANESRLLAEGRYQEGVGSIFEVTDAQSQALDAQTAHIQAQYDYYTALARLDRAIGRE